MGSKNNEMKQLWWLATAFVLFFCIAASVQSVRKIPNDGVVIQARDGTSVKVMDMREWVTFTPSWSANAPTFSTNTGRYRRIGDSMEVAIVIVASGTGTGGTMYFNLPESLSIDTAKIPLGTAPTGSLAGSVGMGAFYDNTNLHALACTTNDTTRQVTCSKATGSGAGQFAGSDFASGRTANIRVTIPILEWR